MRGGWGVAAAVVAAVFSVNASSALADSGGDAREPPHFMFFSGADAWRNGGFAYAGLMWALNNLDSSGPVLKLATGGGIYRYHSGALHNAEVMGRKFDATIMPGWRFRNGDMFVTVFAGLDWQRHKLLPDDPAAGLRGSYLGVRGAIEVWYQPTKTTMVAADATATSIGPSYAGRLGYGWRLFDQFYAGPEISGFNSNGNYWQYRAGFHVTGLNFSKFSRSDMTWLNYEWWTGLGLARDSDRRQSVYVRLGIVMKQ